MKSIMDQFYNKTNGVFRMYYRLFRAYNNHKIQQFDNMLTKQNVPITFDETNK